MVTLSPGNDIRQPSKRSSIAKLLQCLGPADCLHCLRVWSGPQVLSSPPLGSSLPSWATVYQLSPRLYLADGSQQQRCLLEYCLPSGPKLFSANSPQRGSWSFLFLLPPSSPSCSYVFISNRIEMRIASYLYSLLRQGGMPSSAWQESVLA